MTVMQVFQSDAAEEPVPTKAWCFVPSLTLSCPHLTFIGPCLLCGWRSPFSASILRAGIPFGEIMCGRQMLVRRTFAGPSSRSVHPENPGPSHPIAPSTLSPWVSFSV